MSAHTQMKGAGKSRLLPIGTPGSCLAEDDRDVVFDTIDLSGPECRRCRVPARPSAKVGIEFTISTRSPATVLELARTQAASAFDCVDDDPALVVDVGTGVPDQDPRGRFSSDWTFVVNASWDTETGTAAQRSAHERRGSLDRRSVPDRRGAVDRAE